MCGIVGAFAPAGDLPPPERCLSATESLAHRGPDGGGLWRDGPFFLGHRRLAVLDLEAGAQPMASQDGRHVVAFNGEIYNYLELKAELAGLGHVFRTASDTEVLLAGWRHWGTGLPQRLEGMFAFALADRQQGSVFLARDRFGEKPLFVARQGRLTAWASEVKALVRLGVVSPDLDPQALGAYLCLNYVPGQASLLSDVRRLEPGSWHLLTADGVREERFWRFPTDAAPADFPDAAAAAAALEPLLRANVARALRSDVPVGVFLSSGIDSAVVAAAALDGGSRLEQAFCLDFQWPGYSEVEGARRTARSLGLPLTEIPMGPEALADFAALAAHADDPLADSSALAVFTLARAAARQVKVVIGGDGGDELFGGYLTYQASRWHDAAISRLPMALRRLLAAAARHLPASSGKVTASYKLRRFLRAAALPTGQAHLSWNGTWMPDDAARFLADPAQAAQAAASLQRLAAAHGLGAHPGPAALMAMDSCAYLPNDILAKVDRMTMAHGLECRAPLLMPDIAAFAAALPDRLRVPKGGQGKPVLRALAARRLDGGLGRARKQGFSIPIHDWLRGPARDMVGDLLAPAAVARLPLLAPQAVADALARHLRGEQLGFELWGLMILMAWHQRLTDGFADGTAPRNAARLLVLPAWKDA